MGNTHHYIERSDPTLLSNNQTIECKTGTTQCSKVKEIKAW